MRVVRARFTAATLRRRRRRRRVVPGDLQHNRTFVHVYTCILYTFLGVRAANLYAAVGVFVAAN